MNAIRMLVTALMLSLASPAMAGPEFDALLAREAELLERAKAYDEAMYDELVRLREDVDESGRARRAYLRALMHVRGELRRADRDPAFAERERRIRELRREIDALGIGFADLSKRDQKARRGEMETLAGELFDLRQAERRERLEEMEARLAEMREEIESADADRDAIIDGKLDEVIYGVRPTPAPARPGPAP